MTRAEAKRRICECLALQLEGDIDNGSGWLYLDDSGDDFSEADQRRMLASVHEVINEMWRRSGR